jgi:uncharacterized protein YidB (DUF937 family)
MGPAKGILKMGLLDDVLSGLGGKSSAPADSGSAQGGGMSKMTMALLALLAYRTLSGKGKLADMLGTSTQGAPAGTPVPQGGSDQGPMGSTMGGLSDLLRGGLGGLLGGATAGGLAGGLGNMLGGAGGAGGLGGVLSGGLADVVKRMQQNGQGQVAQSWVGDGPNKDIAPNDLESALGGDVIDNLMHQSGMSRDELLKGLSQQLPNLVNKLTPNGRLPDEHEAKNWL